ncbi:MAG: hypothetical protein EUB_03493 [Eubacterium sp.]
MNAESNFKRAISGETMICRVDNLELGDPKILNECFEEKK